MFATALVGLALALRMRRRGQAAFGCVAAAALCVVNPFAWDAVGHGHSDQVLSGALCVAALLAARRGKWLPAGVLLAAAAAADHWVLIAVLPATLWWASARRTPDDVFALVALTFLLAGIVVPATVAVVAWEGLTRRGFPLASALLLASFYLLAQAGVPDQLAAVPVSTWVALRLFAPSLGWRRRAWPLPVPRTAAPR